MRGFFIKILEKIEGFPLIVVRRFVMFKTQNVYLTKSNSILSGIAFSYDGYE